MANTVVVVGSINIDVFHFEPKNEFKGAICPDSKLMDTYILPGGKGANQAAVASWLGAKTYMIGVVGSDAMGSWVLNILSSQGVDISRVTKETELPTSVITTEDREDYKYIVSPGSNAELSKKHIDSNMDIIKKADIVLTQLESPISVVKYLVDVCNKLGKTIILNPDPKIKFDKKLFSKFNYVTPNEHELNEKEIEWLTKNSDTTVIQTLGEHGAVWYKKDGTTQSYKAPKQKVVSTIGAGDTFSGTLAYCLANNLNLDTSIKKAISNSSWSVRQLGAQRLPK